VKGAGQLAGAFGAFPVARALLKRRQSLFGPAGASKMAGESLRRRPDGRSSCRRGKE
jgi:hypothetical protein